MAEASGDDRGRALTALLVLLLALGGFGVWSTLRSRSAAAAELVERERSQPGEPLPPGWGAFVVGRPSGAEPLEREPVEPSPEELRRLEAVLATDGTVTPGDAPAPRTQEEFELSPVSDFELVVQPGQVLSRIVQVYYGAAEPDLVQGLAEYNGLATPDRLRAGATIRLPSERRLRALVAD